MQLLVRAFPVDAGKEHDLRQFTADLQTRAAEAREFYTRMGVARESWHIQQTNQGPWVIAVTQIPERPLLEAAKDYADSKHPFDSWFKGQILQLSGVNPDTTPLGPPTECIFDTHSA